MKLSITELFACKPSREIEQICEEFQRMVEWWLGRAEENPARKRAHGCGRGDRKVGGRAGLQPSRFRKGHGAEGRMARGAT